MRALLRGQSGQATTEYILLLVMAIGFAVFIINGVVKPGFDKIQQSLGRQFDRLFQPGALKSFRF